MYVTQSPCLFMYVTEFHQQLGAATQHDAQEETVSVLTTADTENPAGGSRSKAAEPAPGHPGLSTQRPPA